MAQFAAPQPWSMFRPTATRQMPTAPSPRAFGGGRIGLPSQGIGIAGVQPELARILHLASLTGNQTSPFINTGVFGTIGTQAQSLNNTANANQVLGAATGNIGQVEQNEDSLWSGLAKGFGDVIWGLNAPNNALWGGVEGMRARYTNDTRDPMTRLGDLFNGEAGKAFLSGADNRLETSRTGESVNAYNMIRDSAGIAAPTNKTSGFSLNPGAVAEDLGRWTNDIAGFATNVFLDPASWPTIAAGGMAKGGSAGLAGLIKSSGQKTAGTAALEMAAANSADDILRGLSTEVVEGGVRKIAATGTKGAVETIAKNAATALSQKQAGSLLRQYQNYTTQAILKSANRAGRTAADSTMHMSEPELLRYAAAQVANPRTGKAMREASSRILTQTRRVGDAFQNAIGSTNAVQGTWGSYLKEYLGEGLDTYAKRAPSEWAKLQPFLDQPATVGKAFSPGAKAASDFVFNGAKDASRLALQMPFTANRLQLPGGRALSRLLKSPGESDAIAKMVASTPLKNVMKFTADRGVTGSRLGAEMLRTAGQTAKGSEQAAKFLGQRVAQGLTQEAGDQIQKLQHVSFLSRVAPGAARRQTERIAMLTGLVKAQSFRRGLDWTDFVKGDMQKTVSAAIKPFTTGNRWYLTVGGNPDGYATRAAANVDLKVLAEDATPVLEKIKATAVAKAPTKVATVAAKETVAPRFGRGWTDAKGKKLIVMADKSKKAVKGDAPTAVWSVDAAGKKDKLLSRFGSPDLANKGKAYNFKGRAVSAKAPVAVAPEVAKFEKLVTAAKAAKTPSAKKRAADKLVATVKVKDVPAPKGKVNMLDVAATGPKGGKTPAVKKLIRPKEVVLSLPGETEKKYWLSKKGEFYHYRDAKTGKSLGTATTGEGALNAARRHYAKTVGFDADLVPTWKTKPALIADAVGVPTPQVRPIVTMGPTLFDTPRNLADVLDPEVIKDEALVVGREMQTEMGPIAWKDALDRDSAGVLAEINDKARARVSARTLGDVQTQTFRLETLRAGGSRGGGESYRLVPLDPTDAGSFNALDEAGSALTPAAGVPGKMSDQMSTASDKLLNTASDASGDNILDKKLIELEDKLLRTKSKSGRANVQSQIDELKAWKSTGASSTGMGKVAADPEYPTVFHDPNPKTVSKTKEVPNSGDLAIVTKDSDFMFVSSPAGDTHTIRYITTQSPDEIAQQVAEKRAALEAIPAEEGTKAVRQAEARAVHIRSQLRSAEKKAKTAKGASKTKALSLVSRYTKKLKKAESSWSLTGSRPQVKLRREIQQLEAEMADITGSGGKKVSFSKGIEVQVSREEYQDLVSGKIPSTYIIHRFLDEYGYDRLPRAMKAKYFQAAGPTRVLDEKYTLAQQKILGLLESNAQATQPVADAKFLAIDGASDPRNGYLRQGYPDPNVPANASGPIPNFNSAPLPEVGPSNYKVPKARPAIFPTDKGDTPPLHPWYAGQKSVAATPKKAAGSVRKVSDVLGDSIDDSPGYHAAFPDMSSDMGGIPRGAAQRGANVGAGKAGSSAPAPEIVANRIEKIKTSIFKGDLDTVTDWKADEFIPDVDPTTGELSVLFKDTTTGTTRNFGTFKDVDSAIEFMNSASGKVTVGEYTVDPSSVDHLLDQALEKLDWDFKNTDIGTLRASVHSLIELTDQKLSTQSGREHAAGIDYGNVEGYMPGYIPSEPIQIQPNRIKRALGIETPRAQDQRDIYNAVDPKNTGILADEIAAKAATQREGVRSGSDFVQKHFLNQYDEIAAPKGAAGLKEQSFQIAKNDQRLDQRAAFEKLGFESNVIKSTAHRIETGKRAMGQERGYMALGQAFGRQAKYLGKSGGKDMFDVGGGMMKSADQMLREDFVVMNNAKNIAFTMDKSSRELIDAAMNTGVNGKSGGITSYIKSKSAQWLIPLMTVARPAFTITNTVGNVDFALRNGRLDPESMIEAFHIAKAIIGHGGKAGTTVKVHGELVDATELIADLMGKGVAAPASLSPMIAEITDQGHRHGLMTVPGLKHVLDFNAQANNLSENYFRIAVYLNAKKSVKGVFSREAMPDGAAVAEVNRVMLDYYQSSLTDFERTMRDFIPFYTFTRRNLPASVELLTERPGFANAVYGNGPLAFSSSGTDENGTVQYMSQKDRNDAYKQMSPAQRDSMGGTPIFQGDQMINPKVPLGDFSNYAEMARELFQGVTGEHKTMTGGNDYNPFYQQVIKSGGQMLGPVYKFLAEGMTNADMNTGQEIAPKGDILGRIGKVGLKNIPLVGEFINALDQQALAGKSATMTSDIADGVAVDDPMKGNPNAVGEMVARYISSQLPKDRNLEASNRSWEYETQNTYNRLMPGYESATGMQVPKTIGDLMNIVENAPQYMDMTDPSKQGVIAEITAKYAEITDTKAYFESIGQKAPLGATQPTAETVIDWIRRLYGDGSAQNLLDIMPGIASAEGGVPGGISQGNKLALQSKTTDPAVLTEMERLAREARAKNTVLANANTLGARTYGR